jgi:hypothetical protein
MQGGMRTGNNRGHLIVVVGLIPLAAKAKQ